MFPVLSFDLGPLTIYVFGLILAIGALMSLWMLSQGEKRMEIRPGSASGALLISGLCGFALSKLTYSALNFSRLFFDEIEGTWLGLSPLLDIGRGGHSVYGFITGAIFGLLLFAKLTKQEKGRVFGWAAVPLGVFLCAVFLSQIAGGSGYGEEAAPFLQFIPMSVQNLYGEWNAAVFFYEALWTLMLTLWLKHEKKVFTHPGNRMLMLLIPLCSLQIFFESLRQDDYPRLENNAFIRTNQLLALIILIVILILMFKQLNRAQWSVSVAALLLSAAVFVAAEFWEKLPMPKEALYAASFVMALLLSCIWLNGLLKTDIQEDLRDF